MTLPIPVAGVLIGGKSERMGSPKHLLHREGQTFVERTVTLLAEHGDPVVILGKGELPEALKGRRRIEDSPDFQGPLAGIVSLLTHFPGRPALVVGCDLPFLTSEALHWLLSWLGRENKSVIPTDKAGHIQSCFAIYQSSLLPSIVAGKIRAPKELVGHANVLSPLVPSSYTPALRNVNTTADLAGIDHG